MDLVAAYAEIETKLRTVSGLRVVKWGEKPQVPAAMVLLPDAIERQTYRGLDKVSDVVVLVIVARAVARAAQASVLAYASSIKTLLDPAAWSAFVDLTVTSTTFDTVTIAGAPDVYLAVLFHCDILGSGA